MAETAHTVSKPPTSTLIVTAVRLYGEGLASALTGSGRISVEAIATRAEEGIAAAQTLRPEVTLLDIALAEGGSTVNRLLAVSPETDVIAVAHANSEEHLLACAEAGIGGFVERDGSLRDLLTTIERVRNGELLCSPRFAGDLIRRIAELAEREGTGREARERRLTARQRQVLGLIERGLSNKEIAHELKLELPTVKHHVHHILDKLEVKRRGEAAAMVSRRGRFAPDRPQTAGRD